MSAIIPAGRFITPEVTDRMDWMAPVPTSDRFSEALISGTRIKKAFW
jgi:hypothetical protein